MIFIAAMAITVLALFGGLTVRVALQDLALLETQQAAQRAAEAAAGVAAERVLAEATDAQAAASAEAEAVAAANVRRGQVVGVVTVVTTTETELALVEVALSTSYGGLAGPVTVAVKAAAAVPRPTSLSRSEGMAAA